MKLRSYIRLLLKEEREKTQKKVREKKRETERAGGKKGLKINMMVVNKRRDKKGKEGERERERKREGEEMGYGLVVDEGNPNGSDGVGAGNDMTMLDAGAVVGTADDNAEAAANAGREDGPEAAVTATGVVVVLPPTTEP